MHGWKRTGGRIRGTFVHFLLIIPFEMDTLFGLLLTCLTRLGMASFFLEMIPFASIAFSFTNTVGAALWAADLETARR